LPVRSSQRTNCVSTRWRRQRPSLVVWGRLGPASCRAEEGVAVRLMRTRAAAMGVTVRMT